MTDQPSTLWNYMIKNNLYKWKTAKVKPHGTFCKQGFFSDQYLKLHGQSYMIASYLNSAICRNTLKLFS